MDKNEEMVNKNRLVAIDFGKKRIGIAMSDENQEYAFPHSVILNDENSIKSIIDLCKKENVETIIIGESKDFKGEENSIMIKTKSFVTLLEREGLKVIYEPEIFTTMEAERLQGQKDDIDSSAAALILKSYIDRNKKEIGVTDTFRVRFD